MEPKQIYSTESAPDGAPATSETFSDAALKRADTAAILTTVIGTMRAAGWLVGIATEAHRAYLVIDNAEWCFTPNGWVLKELEA